MKRVVILVAVMAVIASTSAFGAVQDFGKFTADIPEGWTADQYDETVNINKNDETASINLMLYARRGKSAKQLAKFYIEKFDGGFAEISEPKRFKDGGYHWVMTGWNGERSYAMLDVHGRDFMLTVMSGLENAREEISAILSSIKIK